MKHLSSRLVPLVWLMAALSMVGWLVVNLDTAGWILVILTVGLMTFELTREPLRRGGNPGRGKSFRVPDEPRG